jgi:hypothetical protein
MKLLLEGELTGMRKILLNNLGYSSRDFYLNVEDSYKKLMQIKKSTNLFCPLIQLRVYPLPHTGFIPTTSQVYPQAKPSILLA